MATELHNSDQLLAQLRICEKHLDSKRCRKDNSGHRQFVESCIQALEFAQIKGDHAIVRQVDEASEALRTSILLEVLREVTRGAGTTLDKYHDYNNG